MPSSFRGVILFAKEVDDGKTRTRDTKLPAPALPPELHRHNGGLKVTRTAHPFTTHILSRLTYVSDPKDICYKRHRGGEYRTRTYASKIRGTG